MSYAGLNIDQTSASWGLFVPLPQLLLLSSKNDSNDRPHKSRPNVSEDQQVQECMKADGEGLGSPELPKKKKKRSL